MLATFAGCARKEPAQNTAANDQALLVCIRLSDNGSGTREERDRIFALEDEMRTAVEKSKAGVFDANEVDGGFMVLSMRGPSTDKLFETVSPALRKFSPPPGSYAKKRYGPPGSREQEVPWNEMN